jgi:hypothetical protein
MPPAPADPLFLLLLSPYALLLVVWTVVAATLIRWPDCSRAARRMMGLGLGLAMAVGLASLALARPFLTPGSLGFSSQWLFGAGLLLALSGVAQGIRQQRYGQTR